MYTALGCLARLHVHIRLMFIMHVCSVLFCSVLFCSVLFCSILFCSVLFCSVLFCSVLFCSVLFCSVLFCSILFYSRLCPSTAGRSTPPVLQHFPVLYYPCQYRSLLPHNVISLTTFWSSNCLTLFVCQTKGVCVTFLRLYLFRATEHVLHGKALKK